MKRRSTNKVNYAPRDGADDDADDDFADDNGGEANREKNNNFIKMNLTITDTNDDPPSGIVETDTTAPNVVSPRVVKKGPKKLILKSKPRKRVAVEKAANGENRRTGETVTLIRGVNDRKFVLFKSDNFNFSAKRKGFDNNNNNLIHHFSKLETDGPTRLSSTLLMKPLLNSIRPLRVSHTLGLFDRRVTAIEWHPTLSNKVAVGSKGGEIMLLDIAKEDPTEDAVSLSGVGAGGCIGAMRFCPGAPEWLLTSCLNSTVELKNLLNPSKTKILHDTGDWNKWFVSCDLNTSLYAAGQSTGILQLFDRNSLDVVIEQKIHTGKITHVEFSKHHEYLLATSSATGREVKIWDVRRMENAARKPNPLNVLPHDAGVNIASFSRFNGQRLLTSDQYGQIRVYAMPGFYLERSILHPHRQFQHLTPIKASWHPLQDLIVIGRWPDPDFVGYSENEKRTIDIFDANTGKLSLQLYDGSLGGIISLNKFSNDGQFLCSGMSRNVLIWRHPPSWDGDTMEGNMDEILCGDLIDGGGGGGGKAKGKKRQPPKGKQTKGKKDEDLKVKVKTVAKSKTKKGGKKTKDVDDDDFTLG